MIYNRMQHTSVSHSRSRDQGWEISKSISYKSSLIRSAVDADVSAVFWANDVDTVTRGHSLKLFVQQSRIDARKYFLPRDA